MIYCFIVMWSELCEFVYCITFAFPISLTVAPPPLQTCPQVVKAGTLEFGPENSSMDSDECLKLVPGSHVD
jgi:hypothetical protein